MDKNSFESIWNDISQKYSFGKDFYKEFNKMNPDQKIFFVGNYCLLRFVRDAGKITNFCKNKDTWASASKKEISSAAARMFVSLVRIAQEFQMSPMSVFEIVCNCMGRAKIANLPEISSLMSKIQIPQGRLAEALLMYEKIGLMNNMNSIHVETESSTEMYQTLIKTLFMYLMCVVCEFEFISVNDFLRREVVEEISKIDLSPYIKLEREVN